MFCPKCGLTINGNASRCPRCLTKIPQHDQQITPQGKSVNQSNQAGYQRQGNQQPQGYQPQAPQQNYPQQAQLNAGSYGQHYQPNVPPPDVQKYTTMANVALTFGILGITGGAIHIVQYFTFFLSVAAIIIGFIAKKNLRLAAKPTGMATAGMVLGIVGSALTILAIALFGALMVWIYSLFPRW